MQQQPPGPRQELTHCSLAHSANLLLTVTADHNLLLYETRSLQLQKQVSAALLSRKPKDANPPLTRTLTGIPPAPTLTVCRLQRGGAGCPVSWA